MPDIILYNHTWHGFSFPLPRCGRNMQDRPAKLPDTLQLPFTLQHTPDAAPAVVFSDRGIIITRIFKTECHRCPMSGMPLIFFLLLLRFLVLTVQKHCHMLFTDKYLSAKLSPLHPYGCSECFVSLKVFSQTDLQVTSHPKYHHIDIPLRTKTKTSGTFIVKVH